MDVTLVDTSVWIEFLRGTGSRAADYVREHVGIDLAATEPVLLELMAGAAVGPQTVRAERLLAGQAWIPVEPRLDYRNAVEVFHAARATGHPPRALHDCLIAAIALCHGVPVAHRDRDFAHIQQATGLTCVDLRDDAPTV